MNFAGVSKHQGQLEVACYHALMYAEAINVSRMLFMKKSGHRQAGFSIVEGLLIVVTIGVLAGASWVVYQHNRTKVTDAAANGTPPISQQAITPAPAASYLDIKEWGVRLTLDGTTSSLYYYIKPSLPDVPTYRSGPSLL